jgi:hypothetical protein
MRIAILLIAVSLFTVGCTRFYETETKEPIAESPFVDEEARAHNEKEAADTRPYGGIFAEGWAH